MTDPNAPAYPCIPTDRSGQTGPMEYGLTKREAMAMHIMAGVCANSGLNSGTAPTCAKWAVESADALLAELARTGNA